MKEHNSHEIFHRLSLNLKSTVKCPFWKEWETHTESASQTRLRLKITLRRRNKYQSSSVASSFLFLIIKIFWRTLFTSSLWSSFDPELLHEVCVSALSVQVPLEYWIVLALDLVVLPLEIFSFVPINLTYLELLAVVHYFFVKCLKLVSVVTLLAMQVILIPTIYTCHFALDSIIAHWNSPRNGLQTV